MAILVPADLISASVQRKLADIDRYAASLQDQHLSHDGHLYYADPGSLATITTTLSIVQMMAEADPVPEVPEVPADEFKPTEPPAHFDDLPVDIPEIPDEAE